MTLWQLRIDNAINDIKERRASREDAISTRSSEKAQDYLNNIEEAENYDMFLANLNKNTLHLKSSPHSRLKKKEI